MAFFMYAYIRGRLDMKKADGAVVEAGGVGYYILAAPSVLSRLPEVNSEVKLYTHFTVREDAHTLYGFLSREELGMFETLLTVSGVGPKAALALVSALPPSQFGLAVLTEDHKMLARAQGVGAKLAQKIIFELRDKMKKELSAMGGGGLDGAASAFAGSAGAAGADGGAGMGFVDRSKFGEAVEALMVLGCTAVEAHGAVANAYKEELPLEAIIRGALVAMGQ